MIDCTIFRHKLPTWNPLAQVVVLFINTCDDDVMEDQVELVLRAFLNVNMLNVNVIAYQKDTSLVRAFTYYPYGGSNCANEVTHVITFDICEYNDNYDLPFAEITSLEKMKPKVPGKLHECPLRISSAISEPYVFYDRHDDTFTRGTEVLMIRTIAEALQMAPVFSLNHETRENRLISNETGVYSALFQRHVIG